MRTRERMETGGSAATPAPCSFFPARTRCKVMGIVNATPDSFSDGGLFDTPEKAVARARALMDDGAAMIDVGGESTRPSATPLEWRGEWARIGETVRILAPECSARGVALSVDTYHPETAKLAAGAGATMLNCVYAGHIAEMAEICESSGAILCAPAECFASVRRLAGRRGTPGGLPSLYIDPMVGFGTTREQDLELIRSAPGLGRQCATLVGVSRKRIVAHLTERAAGGLGGSVAIAVWCALNGVSAVRVHDVRETVDAISAAEAVAFA